VAAIDAPGHGDRPRSEHDERSTAAIRQKMGAGEPAGSLIASYNAQVTRQAVPEWRAVLDDLLALDGQDSAAAVGYCGVALGGAIGVQLIAAEPRISAAVIGLIGDEASQAIATRVTIPVQMVLQWDDELVSRQSGLVLFDALASSEKTLHANSGRHLDLPRFEINAAERFFVRHLAGTRTDAS
jgi:pimeloyl-ACP methyl ester carboxylesterase